MECANHKDAITRIPRVTKKMFFVNFKMKTLLLFSLLPFIVGYFFVLNLLLKKINLQTFAILALALPTILISFFVIYQKIIGNTTIPIEHIENLFKIQAFFCFGGFIPFFIKILKVLKETTPSPAQQDD